MSFIGKTRSLRAKLWPNRFKGEIYFRPSVPLPDASDVEGVHASLMARRSMFSALGGGAVVAGAAAAAFTRPAEAAASFHPQSWAMTHGFEKASFVNNQDFANGASFVEFRGREAWFKDNGGVPDYNITAQTGTDNTPALQTLIFNLAASGGGVIRIGNEGNYYFANTFVVPYGITIAGIYNGLSCKPLDATFQATQKGIFFLAPNAQIQLGMQAWQSCPSAATNNGLQTYIVGNIVANGGKAYKCTAVTATTSGVDNATKQAIACSTPNTIHGLPALSGGGPTGTGASITDNKVTWSYVTDTHVPTAFSSGGSIRGLIVLAAAYAYNYNTISDAYQRANAIYTAMQSWAGVAVTCTGGNNDIRDCFICGFDWMVQVQYTAPVRFDHIFGDCQRGIFLICGADVCRVTNCHQNGYWGSGGAAGTNYNYLIGSSQQSSYRLGPFYREIGGSGGNMASDLYCFNNVSGFELLGTNAVVQNLHCDHVDNNWTPYNGFRFTGFLIQGTGNKLFNCQSSGLSTSVRINGGNHELHGFSSETNAKGGSHCEVNVNANVVTHSMNMQGTSFVVGVPAWAPATSFGQNQAVAVPNAGNTNCALWACTGASGTPSGTGLSASSGNGPSSAGAGNNINPPSFHGSTASDTYTNVTDNQLTWTLVAVPWVATQGYNVGDQVTVGLATAVKIYICTTAGTSGSTAPSATTTGADTITDGSVKWRYQTTDSAGYYVIGGPGIQVSSHGAFLTNVRRPWLLSGGANTRNVTAFGSRWTKFSYSTVGSSSSTPSADPADYDIIGDQSTNAFTVQNPSSNGYSARVPIACTTTDATPTYLTTDRAAGNSGNQLAPSAHGSGGAGVTVVSGTITAIPTAGATLGSSATWIMQPVTVKTRSDGQYRFMRAPVFDILDCDPALQGLLAAPVLSLIQPDSGLSGTGLSGPNTNTVIAVQITGIASTTISWMGEWQVFGGY